MSRELPSPELIAAAQAGDAKALEGLIHASQWVITAQLKRRRHVASLSGSADDLRQAALVGDTGKGGLLGAISTFDHAGGANFWTHITKWIQGAVYREANTRSDSNLINRRRQRRRFVRIKTRLVAKLGREPTNDELATEIPGCLLGASKHAKVSIEEATDLGRNGGRSGTRGNSGGPVGRLVAELLSDTGGEERATRMLDARRAAALLAELPDRERQAFELHVFDERTFTEIGAELGISREWARQAYLVACKRMRAMMTPPRAA